MTLSIAHTTTNRCSEMSMRGAFLLHLVHCYGTGSCRSEPGSGGLMHHTRNRTCAFKKKAGAAQFGLQCCARCSCLCYTFLVCARSNRFSDAVHCTVVTTCRIALFRSYERTQNIVPFSVRYGFWSLNRFLLHQLYFLNRRRRHFGRRSASSVNDADGFTRVYGSAAPSSLPETALVEIFM